MRAGAVLAAGLVGMAVLVSAGCGGGSAAPSVATLATTGASSTQAPGAPSGGGGPTGPRTGPGSVVFSGEGVAAFSACMRSHGVPDFPDPDSRGDVLINGASGLDPGSPRFQSAEKACQSLMPGPTPAQLAEDEKGALRYSACMRSHGLPDFPDPTFSNGDIAIRWMNPRSPAFRAAQKTCAPLLGLPG